MEHIVSTSDFINGYEVGATGLIDILQCVHILLTTIKGTVFLDRNLGISPTIIDTPQNLLGMLNQEIYEQIEAYEPRVKVNKIKISNEHDIGVSEIKVEVIINEEFI